MNEEPTIINLTEAEKNTCAEEAKDIIRKMRVGLSPEIRLGLVDKWKNDKQRENEFAKAAFLQKKDANNPDVRDHAVSSFFYECLAECLEKENS